MSKEIVIVAAFGINREIGKDNQLPWSIKAEMDHFRKTTLKGTVLMGTNTALSIGTVLKGRKNLVLTKRGKAPFPGQISVASLEEALSHTETDSLMIIGGESLYRQFMPVADKLIVSHIDVEVPDADAFFPEIDPAVFKQTSADIHLSNDEITPNFAVWEFVRIKPTEH